MGPLDFFYRLNPAGRNMALGGLDSASNRNEYQAYPFGRKQMPVHRTDNFATCLCRMSLNPGYLSRLQP